MPTAFVTGGTGFLGRNLVTLLRAEGWDVIALHRPSSDVDPLRRLGVELREADLTDPVGLRRVMPHGVDAVFHVAASTSTWRGGNAEQTRANVDGTRNVVDAALGRNARRFVHTSSIASYGTAAYRQRIDERTPSDAATHWVNYIRTKWLAEQEVRRGVAHGLDAVIVNPANVVGAYDTHNWSRLFRLAALGQLPGAPPGRGSWCDVREVARAHLAAAERGRAGENYLLGGEDASYAEVTRLVAGIAGASPPTAIPAWALRAVARVVGWTSRITGQEPEVTPEGTFFVCGTGSVDSRKAERELGYRTRPWSPLVEETVAWMRAEGQLAGRVPPQGSPRAARLTPPPPT